MPTYEITLQYPDRPFDAHCQFLAEVGRNPRSGLIAFHRYRNGTALTVQVQTDRGPELAQLMAHQRAASFWPGFRPERVAS